MATQHKRIFLKSLTPARQALILCMHEKQFGAICNLPVSEGQPLLEKAKVTKRRRLDKQTSPKPVSKNFCLKAVQVRLLESLDEIRNGELQQILFRDGLPCELDQHGA